MNVYQAINKVQADLCKQGIGKDSTNSFDNYKFRGIDAVYNALSPLLAKYGLCILPRMLSRSCEERQSQKGGALFYVTVEAEFDFVAAEDGSKHTVKTFGEAMDRGDKATNKAMSAAYKYAAFQAFAIPTEGDNDADSSSHEVKPVGLVESRKKISTSYAETLTVDRRQVLSKKAGEIAALWEEAPDKALEEYVAFRDSIDVDEQAAFKHFLDEENPKLRNALLKHFKSVQPQAA